MAEYSKEYIEIVDLGGMSWDFSIREIANHLDPGNYVPMICEGMGFSLIGKDPDNNIILYFQDFDNEDKSTWRDLEEVEEGLIERSKHPRSNPSSI